MTYYPDLSRYEYSDSERAMLNVGWLDRSHLFPVGQVSDAFIRGLIVCADDLDHIMRGMHYCDFCDEESPLQIPAPTESGFVWLGMGEIHIDDLDGRVYSAPSLIVHYVVEHGYYPPEEFQAAVVRHTAGR